MTSVVKCAAAKCLIYRLLTGTTEAPLSVGYWTRQNETSAFVIGNKK
jgi:hypothetical protein